MGKVKQTRKKEQEMFTYEDTPDPNKVNRRKIISLILGGITIISLIVLGTVFSANRDIFSRIFFFYCTYLWILPLLFISLRGYQFSKHSKRETKIGRIYMVFGFYFLFLWATSLTGLLVCLSGLNIAWLTGVLFWGSLCFFIPYLLFVLIFKL